jgi:hypothetical protein
MKKLLDVDMTLDGIVITIIVNYQCPSLRNKSLSSEMLLAKGEHYTIKSKSYLELTSTTLFLHGTSDYDKSKARHYFSTEEKALAVYNELKYLINIINGVPNSKTHLPAWL